MCTYDTEFEGDIAIAERGDARVKRYFDCGKCERAGAFLQKVAPDRMLAQMMSSIRQADGCHWKSETPACGSSLGSSRNVRVSLFVCLLCDEAPSCRCVSMLSA